MTGENFKRFHQTKTDVLKECLTKLTREKSKVWDDFCNWCRDGGEQRINYEFELKRLQFEIENIKYLMEHSY